MGLFDSWPRKSEKFKRNQPPGDAITIYMCVNDGMLCNILQTLYSLFKSCQSPHSEQLFKILKNIISRTCPERFAQALLSLT